MSAPVHRLVRDRDGVQRHLRCSQSLLQPNLGGDHVFIISSRASADSAASPMAKPVAGGALTERSEAQGDYHDARLFLFELCCFHSACAGRPSLTGVDAPMSHVVSSKPD